MSFTRGVTPRGLPYPGTDEPVYNVPLFLQQLADAVNAAFASSGSTQLLVPWAGAMTTNGNGSLYIPIPGLALVRGALVTPNAAYGGTGPWLYMLLQETWTDANQRGKAVVSVRRLTDGGSGYPSYVGNTSCGLNVLAWGDPA